MADEVPDDDILSDLDGDEEASNAAPSDALATEQRLHDLLTELEQERRLRKFAEDSRAELQTSVSRLKAFAQDVIKKRDDALREKEELIRSSERAIAELSEAVEQKEEALRQKEDALKQKDEALRQKQEALRNKDSSRAEIETAAQMMVTGIEKISSKVSGFKNFSAGGLPRSQKYTGLPAVAYGVINRANEIVQELTGQIDAAVKSRDQAREQVEQRNYEIAIEVSQLEATINGLREDATKKGTEIELLGKLVEEKDSRILVMEKEVSELKEIGGEASTKLRNLEAKVDAQRHVTIDHLKHLSKAYAQINSILQIVDESLPDHSDLSDSSFVWKETDIDQNLRASLEGTVSISELASVASEKVRLKIERRNREVKDLEEKIDALLEEKQHIGALLRSALSSKTNKVLQVAEEGLREAGIDLKFNEHDSNGVHGEEENEIYTLAGALENTVKISHIEIIELRHLVEALRAESGLLKAHLDAQAKEIDLLMQQMKELKEREHIANENVEGLMTDIAAAEEEIARWKLAAEQEAAAGKAVEQEFLSKLSSLGQELEEAKHAKVDLGNKLKFKEGTAGAAIAARDAAENSLRLADVRTNRLRERVEELSRQLEQLDKSDPRTRNSHRYICWPWQWLGLDHGRQHPTHVQENSNEMELSEPLI
ncbi:hypothetical protein KSP40_PGU000876 [Platanthera guangdongensis]|uniref:Paramyosin n=1 Tax=Platanthera guangdongensis TaxID=2320717 RepID=A0ABR2LK92_9ASPA